MRPLRIRIGKLGACNDVSVCTNCNCSTGSFARCEIRRDQMKFASAPETVTPAKHKLLIEIVESPSRLAMPSLAGRLAAHSDNQIDAADKGDWKARLSAV